jgi:hypothetical protein
MYRTVHSSRNVYYCLAAATGAIAGIFVEERRIGAVATATANINIATSAMGK